MSRRPTSGVPPLAAISKNDRSALGVKGKIDPSPPRTLRCRTVAKGHLRQLNYIRNLPPQAVMEDEPDNLLGDATAPNASEVLLAAFGSCFAVGIHANAVVQGIPIRSLELELEADINTTSVWGVGDATPKAIGFETIRVLIHLEADAPRETLDTLVHHALLWSPVANTLHNPVHLEVRLALD
jgi:uncharacterized OsmC-like protein